MKNINYQAKLSLRRFVSLVLLVVLIATLIPTQSVRAETVISTNITQDAVWSGDYRVTAAVSLVSGVRLVLQPGTTVRFDSGAGIDSYGQMLALGEPGNPVVFTSDVGNWRGLRFLDDDAFYGPSELWGTIIELGGTQGGSVIIDNAQVTIANSEIRMGVGDGVLGYANGTAIISDTLITTQQGYALRFTDPGVDPILARLEAYDNGHNVIALAGGGIGLGGDHVWENAGLPYEIQGTGTVVAKGETLIVEPGVTVRFAYSSSLDVAGRLIAAGTPDDPITFSGVTPTPGIWDGINLIGSFASPATGVISYAIIEYGGSGSSGGNLRVENARVSVQYSRLSNGGAYGVHVANGGLPVISYSQIVDNALGGVKTLRADNQVPALNNWWGDASGPFHPDTNPDGLGNSVSDNVLYDPWLTSPGDAGPQATQPVGLQVEVIGRTLFAPGSLQTYAIAYRNNTINAINDAVLVAFLPDLAQYITNDGTGYYWFDREQVYWRLGTLLPGETGIVAVTVEYRWGLPFGTRDSILAALAGSNAPNELVVLQDYLTYTPPTVTSRVELNQAQVDALRAGNTELNQLYNAAISAGFVWTDAIQEQRSDGTQQVMVNLLRVSPQLAHQTIFIAPDGVTTRIADRESYQLGSTRDTLLYDPQTGEWTPQGGGSLFSAAVQTRADDCEKSYGQCMSNCVKKAARSRIAEALIPLLGIAESVNDCLAAKNGDDIALVNCSKTVFKKIPGYEEGVDLGVCNTQCQGDPCSNDCNTTGDIYDCDNQDWLYGTFGLGTKTVKRCNTETGLYYATETQGVCPVGQKCVLISGVPSCVNCSTGQPSTAGTQGELILTSTDAPNEEGASSGGCSECQPAQDPNAKLGVEGLVAPGQEMFYTVQYENVGAGEAYGVFVIDTLAEAFDETSLSLGSGGRYLAATRTILWDVGTLAPKGEPGSEGEFTFSVRLRSDLPAGTVVTNRAVVYFPSVPEITPTNEVANIVQPLAGADQQLEMTSGQTLGITLNGFSAAGGLLDYAVVSLPEYGTLTGNPPAVVYTPRADFTGQDALYFTVSDGVETSQPARVAIRVLPNPNDKTPPVLIGSSPADGAQVSFTTRVRGQDEGALLYTPALRADFSEVIAPESLTGAAVQLIGPAGESVAISVVSDPTTRSVRVMPQQLLKSGATYSLRLAPPLADEMGNAITQAYNIAFNPILVGGSGRSLFLPMIAR